MSLHAALADPSRLRIVDTLAMGDASPKELQELLDISSNLLAHHLRILEREGLLFRHHSQADGRRSYLQLVRSMTDGLLPDTVVSVPRVVFVCTANSARSQLAAALWRRASAVPVASAGTHPADRISSGAVAVARRNDLPLRQLRPQPLADVLCPDDYLVTVCDHAHEELRPNGHAPDPTRRLHWSVPDPVPVGTPDAFDAAFADLTRRVTDLVPRLTAA